MPPVEDLTARARIRDAALVEFGARGVSGATIRAIAERAGFSPALVQHHFGTKDGLRDACDRHVLEYFHTQAEAGLDDHRLGEPAFLGTVYEASQPVVKYLARALVDGSPAAAAVFDEMVELVERYLVDRSGLTDARTRAAVYTATRLGGLVLHEHLSRLLGVDVLTNEAGPHVSRAMLDPIAPDPALAAFKPI
ncbi:MAG: TetR family transcriptional regulator [Pseudonocardia sp.]|nr:TetR family transcriptional regulator [Pseudonocardia sp.]